MKSCWEFRKHAQIGESATKKDSCGQFEFLRLSCFGHLFGWGLFIQIPSPDFLLAFVWVGVGYGVHFKNWIQYPSFIHIDALFRLFSMNMTYIHVPNITCRFRTPHSGGPRKDIELPSICGTGAGIGAANWPCLKLRMAWSRSCTSIVMVHQLLLTIVPVIPTSSQPQWPGDTNHNGLVQQYSILFCIVVGITRSGVEFRSWISSWPGVFGIFASQTNKPTQVLLRQHTPKGTYPRPSTNPLWFGIPFLLGFVPEAPGISWGSLG